MTDLTFTLLADGASDAALIPILTWTLRQRMPGCAMQAEIADLRRMPNPPRDLPTRIQEALNLYPCDVLFVHRDAENQDPERRYCEIKEAIERLAPRIPRPRCVCVVPVRMQEAWLLIDPAAIRRAAGNPNGTAEIVLPAAASIESIPDPKERLYELLKIASELSGRRLKKFRPERCAHLIAENILDFLPLRQLPAFRRLEADIVRIASSFFL